MTEPEIHGIKTQISNVFQISFDEIEIKRKGSRHEKPRAAFEFWLKNLKIVIVEHERLDYGVISRAHVQERAKIRRYLKVELGQLVIKKPIQESIVDAFMFVEFVRTRQ